MRLRVRHLTRFEYEDWAKDSFNDVRLCPITDGFQRLQSFSLRLNPAVSVFVYHDFYHNRVDHFEISETHSLLEVESMAVVETFADLRGPVPMELPAGSLNEPDATENFYDFLTDTHYVSLDAEIWRAAVDVLPNGVQHLWYDSVKIGEHISRRSGGRLRTLERDIVCRASCCGRGGACAFRRSKTTGCQKSN